MNKQTMKRVVAFLLLGALVLGIIPLAALAAEADASALSSSVGIIGGADGPTAIFVTGDWGGIISTLLLIAGGICGLIAVCKAWKKRRQ